VRPLICCILLLAALPSQASVYMNADCRIDFADFALFASSWQSIGSALPANFNGDSLVDWKDLALLADSWLSHEAAAQCAADTGFSEAVRLMQEKLSVEALWDNNYLPSATDANTPAGCATYSFSIIGDPNAGFSITSTGTSGVFTKTIHGTLATRSAWMGITVSSSVDLKSLLAVTTYPDPNLKLTIRTDSTEKWAVLGNTYINGDIVFGPGGSIGTVVKLLPGASVSGSIYPALAKMNLPHVTPPSGLPAMTYVPGTPLQSGVYESLSIAEPATVAPASVVIYVTGTMTVASTGSLSVPADASLRLYLGNNLTMSNGASMSNLTNDSLKMRLYGLSSCNSISMKCPGILHAAIYAPDTDMMIDNAGSFIGALAARSLVMLNSGSFYFDARLSNASIDDIWAFLDVTDKWQD
jgi:hypothetical protein